MKLTTEQRKRLRTATFALPKQRKYPINDKAHAIAALARVKQHGTKQEQSIVERKVYKKFPSLKK